MRKFILWTFACVLLCASLYFIVISPPMYGGMLGDYNPITRKVRCREPSVCLHEIGHKIDHENGWISRTDEWVEAIESYRNTRGGVILQNGVREMIMQAPRLDVWQTPDRRGGHLELYANILMFSGGDSANIPEWFVRFYDWDRVNELQEQYLKEEGAGRR